MNNKYRFFKRLVNVVGHILYLFGVLLYFNFNSRCAHEMILIVISIIFYILSVLSFVIPNFTHRIMYKLGELFLKYSDTKIEYEGDSLKKYIKYRYLFMLFALLFLLLEMFLNIL